MPKKKSPPTTPLVPVNPEILTELAAATASKPPVFVPGRGTVVTMKDLPMDEETKVEVGKQFLSIRDLQGYPNGALSHRMEQVWGAFTTIRTGTDKENSVFFLYKGDSKSKKQVKVNRSGTQNLVNFSLAVPLGKFELRPTPDRQWNLVAQEVTVPDGPPVFMFNVVERESVPRNLKAEQAALGTTVGADGSAAGAAPAKAVKGKGSAQQTVGKATATELDAHLDDEDEIEDQDA
jgi:hypothetical protein